MNIVKDFGDTPTYGVNGCCWHLSVKGLVRYQMRPLTDRCQQQPESTKRCLDLDLFAQIHYHYDQVWPYRTGGECAGDIWHQADRAEYHWEDRGAGQWVPGALQLQIFKFKILKTCWKLERRKIKNCIHDGWPTIGCLSYNFHLFQDIVLKNKMVDQIEASNQEQRGEPPYLLLIRIPYTVLN